MKDRFPLLVKDFSPGWIKREDESMLPLGGARIMSNMRITERKGIAPRLGEVLYAQPPGTDPITSIYSFKKSQSQDILVFSSGTGLYYRNNITGTVAPIKTGYTSGKIFGYKEGRMSNDQTDWLYFCNGVQSYSRWNGYETKLTTALVGGETTIQVDDIFTENAAFTGTASSCTTTTITMPAGTWATNIWNNFYVHITSGAQTGKVSLISTTTATQITFATIAGLSGTPTFQIRQSQVSPTGTLSINGTEVAYTAIVEINKFSVASAPASTIDSPVTTTPIEYPANPKGNIFETLFADMYVSGAITSPITVYRSVTANPASFTFGSPRVKNEGDIFSVPYAGGAVLDMMSFEDKILIGKENSLEQVKYIDAYSGGNDTISRDPVLNSEAMGLTGKFWRLDNDIAFMTPDKKITTLGRVNYRDFRPQIFNLGDKIVRALNGYGVDKVRGGKYQDDIFVSLKSQPENTANDITLPYNTHFQSWQGIWTIPSSGFVYHNSKYYYADSFNSGVYELFAAINKTDGTTVYDMSSRWVSGWTNINGNGFWLNEISMIGIEGYISSGTTINVKLYRNFNYDSFADLQIIGSEEQYLDGTTVFSVLGTSSLGTEPLGTASLIGDEEDDGMRHFIIFLPFPTQQVDYVSAEFSSSGKAQRWEIIRYAINNGQTTFEDQTMIKS